MQLFFFPYFGGGPSEYQTVLSQLDEFDCVAFSNAGLGQKDGGYSVRQAVEDMATLVESHAEGDYVLIGHSMTGKMALGVAARGPQGLKGLILLAPSPPTPELIPDAVRARMLNDHGSREAAIVTLRSNWKVELIGETLENAILADLETSATDWKNWLETGSHEDISEMLADLKVPVLVLTGEFDGGMTPELLNREIISKIPGAQLEVIPGAGHFLPMEAPDEVAEKIEGFVNGLGGREA